MKLQAINLVLIAKEATMSRHFELDWNDLSYEKQQEMIDSMKEEWMEALKLEALQEINSKQINRHGITNNEFWLKFKADNHLTDEQLYWMVLNELYEFDDYSELTDTIWDAAISDQVYKSLYYSVESFAEEKAEEACQQGIRHMEIEVETP